MATELNYNAVKALVREPYFWGLINTDNRRKFLSPLPGENPPDWIIAGLNCTNDADILPMCIWVFLTDWEPPK
jgi:hypothetical protein